MNISGDSHIVCILVLLVILFDFEVLIRSYGLLGLVLVVAQMTLNVVVVIWF